MEEIILKGICDLYSNGDFDKIIDSDSVYKYKDTVLESYAKDLISCGEKIALDNAVQNALAHGELKGFENGLKVGLHLIIH